MSEEVSALSLLRKRERLLRPFLFPRRFRQHQQQRQIALESRTGKRPRVGFSPAEGLLFAPQRERLHRSRQWRFRGTCPGRRQPAKFRDDA